MSTEQEANNQDPKNIENEPKASDELAPEELDQVTGGTGGIYTPPTQPPTSPTTTLTMKYDGLG